MLRVYFLQQWYALAGEALEDAIYDSQAMRDFIGIDLAIESVPDATTLLRFRHLLEKHALTQRIFEEINASLTEQGLFMREGTIVDATIIAASPSTKNRAKQRDPEMKHTKKGSQWYFGMKAHIGVDAATGLTHTVVATSANVADVTMAGNLVRDDDEGSMVTRSTSAWGTTWAKKRTLRAPAAVLPPSAAPSRRWTKVRLTRYAWLYNHHIPQRALYHRSPIAAMKES